LFLYRQFEENIYFDEEIGWHTTYGIKVYDSNNMEVMSISDVNINESFVNKLCEICTRIQLDPIHLYDVIEDSLAGERL